jgi:PAS domain S-box-containing protein
MSEIDRNTFVQRFMSSVSHSYGDALFEDLPDIQFFIKDSKGRYVKVNRALMNNYLMSSDDDIIGKTDHELFPAYLADNFVRDDRRVLAGEVIRNRIELVGHYDGTAAWFQTTKIPLRDERTIIGLAGITRDLGKTSATVFPFQEMRVITQHIEEHFADEITVEMLARIAGLSARSLQRKFRAVFRLSPLQYVRRVRINKASNLLVTTSMGISAVAASTGFADQSHLTREFVRCVGTTPKAFRARYYHAEDDSSTPSPRNST